jgi:O-antigen/teichoic acid export membrane protein/thymidylate kinase
MDEDWAGHPNRQAIEEHMIVETFGPPGAGKTTFTDALVERLRERGYTVDHMLTLPRPKAEFLCRGGVIPAIVRLIHAIFVTMAILCRPISNAKGLRLAQVLLRMMPPDNPVWRIRLSQYILRFCCVWNGSHKPDHIAFYDQGFVQVVITLALFSGADRKTIAQAISMRSQSDLVIRFDAPTDLLEQRLHQRRHEKPLMEKWFEADVQTFLKAKPITDYVASLLAEDRRLISVNSLDPVLMRTALDQVEEEISARFGKPAATDLQSSPQREENDHPPETCGPTTPPSSVTPISTTAQTELTGHLARASLWSFLVYVGGAGVTCLAQLAIARKVGAPSYGVYSYVLAWMTLLAYVATLGFDIVLLRFAPAYSAKEQWSLARGVLRFAFRTSFFVAMMFAISGIVIVSIFAKHDELTISLQIALAIVPLTVLCVLGGAAVRTLGGVISAIAPERLVRDGLMLVIVLLAGTLGITTPDATTVLSALLVSSGVAAAMLGWSVFKRWPPQLRSVEPAYATGDWWQLALPVLIMAGVDVLLSRTGVILLGWIGDTRAAGLFALGLNLALVLILPRVAVGTFFSPNASKLHANHDKAGLQKLFAQATVLSLAGTIALALPLLVLTEPLLQYFGDDFVGTAAIAQILIVGQIFAAAMGPQQILLTMTGHERAAAKLMVIGGIINVLGCAIGIAFYGAIGAAVATATTYIIWNLAMAIYISKRGNLTAGLLFALQSFRRRRLVRE